MITAQEFTARRLTREEAAKLPNSSKVHAFCVEHASGAIAAAPLAWTAACDEAERLNQVAYA